MFNELILEPGAVDGGQRVRIPWLDGIKIPAAFMFLSVNALSVVHGDGFISLPGNGDP